MGYVRQATYGPEELAFLPAYYAILNLLKIDVLFSAHYAKLPENRWHGASYNGYSKNSQSLLTEEIRVHNAGAIPLVPILGGMRQFEEGAPLLRGFKKDPSEQNVFHRLAASGGTSEDDAIHRSVNGALLYYPVGDYAITPMSGGTLRCVEEVPLALAFFHMGSVVRYKPEFLARLRDSRLWPVLAALRMHGLYRMRLLCLSYVRQEILLVERREGSRRLIKWHRLYYYGNVDSWR